MNKRLLAVAVTGALSSVAAATAQAEVTIYGRLYPQFQTVKISGATLSGTTTMSTLVDQTPSNATQAIDPPSRQEVNASSSAIGFRASTDLGGGMKGFMQVESEVPADEGDGFLASRSTFVGLSGGFGTVYLGRMDTVYKDLGGPVSFLGVSAGNFISESNIISKNGAGRRNSNTEPFGGSFHRRQNHMVRYETPEMSGLQFLFQYAPDEDKNNTPGLPGTAGLNRTVTSMGVKWEAGPLYLALAHETHKDFFGGSLNTDNGIENAEVDFPSADPDEVEELTLVNVGARSKDTAMRFSWSYKLGDTKIGGDFAQLEYKETGGLAGDFASYEHNTWDLGVEQKLGNITLAANYANSGEGKCALVGGAACSTSGLKGNQIAVGASYSFAKNVSLFGLYAKLTNGASSQYDNLENGRPRIGADTTQMAVGVLYRF